MVSKFHNEISDPEGHENKIYTLVKGRETFYRRPTDTITSCTESKEGKDHKKSNLPIF